jgi:XTP/dITP diphosphohydrolase
VTSAPEEAPGLRLLELVAVMDRLRSPGGCPWDAEQTHASLVTYLLEEAYETIEALEIGDAAAMREELGDLLLQVVFHARLGAEEDPPWDIDDVAGGIVDKLIARHPHVFGDATADSAAHVEVRWDAMKRAEKGRTSAVDGVPLAQPALALTAKLIGRTERAGVDVDQPGGSTVEGTAFASEEALGDTLFAIVAEARVRGLDAERALRAASRRYVDAVRAAETSTQPPP